MASTFPGATIGKLSSAVWTMTVACTRTTACEGDIASDDGNTYGPSYDGEGLSVAGSGSSEDLCVDEAGTEVPGSLFRSTSGFSSTVPEFSALLEGVEVVMGTQKIATTNTPIQNCAEIISSEQTWSVRMTRFP